MKYLALDWERAFGFLEALGKVTPATRQRLARADLRALFEARALGDDVLKLLASGIATPTLDTGYARLSEPFHDLHKLLRMLQRVPLHSSPSEELLERYVLEHFEEDERYCLGKLAEGVDEGLYGAVARLTSTGHTRTLLEARDPAEWEQELLERAQVLARGRAPEPRFTAESGADLRLVLLHVIGGPGHVRVRELPGLFPELTRARLAVVVALGLRYGLWFAGLEGQGELVLFQWPRVHARLHAGVPQPPAPVMLAEDFVFAWAVEDLQHLLVTAGEGLRLKADGSGLFAADERELVAGLVPLPDWMSELDPEVSFEPEDRVRRAVSLALSAGYAATRELERGSRLEVSERGWSWLGRSARARLEVLLEAIRDSLVQPDGRSTGPFRISLRSTLFVARGDEGRVARAIAGCFGSLAPGQAYPLRAFLRHYAGASSPLHKLVRKRPDVLGEYAEDDLEEEFDLDLRTTLLMLLLPFGGVRAGRAPSGEPCIALEPAGRYVLGLVPELVLDTAQREEAAPVRVQPDFEVVFVAPSPMLEARIGRFAERRGKGVGVLFRITRESILGAARTGLTAEEVLATLREASATPLPVNVVHELETWFARCRRIASEPVQLLRCPDPETAERVLAIGARHLERLTPTVLALRDPSKRAELVRACAKHGLFLDERPAAERS